jgi:hypothetical protein
MKTKLLLLVSTLAFAGAAYAQNAPTSGVVVSTDPAKIAEIERHAQQLGAMPAAAPAQGHPNMSEEHRAMHERMHKPGYKQGYKHGYRQGSHDHAGMKDGKGHPPRAMHDGKGPHGDKHPMMDGKGPHGHPMMDGKGPHGAKPAMPVDAPAKP